MFKRTESNLNVVVYVIRGNKTGQFADKPTRGQSSCGLVNSRTSQLAEMFDLKLAVNNR